MEIRELVTNVHNIAGVAQRYLMQGREKESRQELVKIKVLLDESHLAEKEETTETAKQGPELVGEQQHCRQEETTEPDTPVQQ